MDEGSIDGSEVRFCGMMGAPEHRKETCKYVNKKGVAIQHLGRRRHGAVEIERGERMNLIMWSRSSFYREGYEYGIKANMHKKENGAPDKVCLSYTHDKDYGVFKSYTPELRRQYAGRGWCPKRSAEYAGYRDEPGTPPQGAGGRGRGRGRR